MMFFTPIYPKLWLNWIVPSLQGKQAMLELELHLLNEAEAKIVSSAGAASGTEKNTRKAALPLPLVLAQSWMYYHLEQDSSAWQKLVHGGSAYGIPPEHLLYFLHSLTDTTEWTRLSEWLIQLGPLLAHRRNAPLQDYMRLWDVAIQHVPDSEHRMWDTLVSMLPTPGLLTKMRCIPGDSGADGLISS